MINPAGMKMPTLEITKETARRLVLQAQCLNGSVEIDSGKAGAAQIITALGYIQIDITMLYRDISKKIPLIIPDIS